MKRLILVCVFAEVVLLIALSYIKNIFPYFENDIIFLNAALQILFKELILIPMFVIIIAARKTGAQKYHNNILAVFILIAVADAAIALNILAGLGVFAVVWGLIGYSLTAEFIRKGIKPGLPALVAAFGAFIFVFSVFLYFFNGPLTGQTIVWTAVFIYTLVMGYGVAVGSITWRLGNFEFAFCAAAGTVLFFICDCQVAYNELIYKQHPDVWANNVIYYSGLFFLSLTAVFKNDSAGADR